MALFFDTFTDVALDASIQGNSWDTAGITWTSPTYLVGDGAGGVKIGPGLTGAFVVAANFVNPANTVQLAVFFKPTASRVAGGSGGMLRIGFGGTTNTTYGDSKVTASVGGYDKIFVRDIGGSAQVESTGTVSFVAGQEYCLELQQVGAALFKAVLYAASNGVRGAVLLETPNQPIATPFAASALNSQIWKDNSANSFTITRIESSDALTTGAAPQPVAAVLSNATATANGNTALNGTVSTTKSSGTLYYKASTATTETVASLKAASSKAVTASGTQNVSVAGLADGTWYLHYLHVSDSLDSNVVRSSGVALSSTGGTNPPVLSNPTASANGATGASGNVGTDKASGNLYTLFSTSSSGVTGPTIKGGTPQAVTNTGTQSISKSGLNPNTTYYMWAIQTDANGADSNIVVSPAFTTPAVDTTAPAFAGGAVITPGTITASSLAFSWPAATDTAPGVVAGYQKSKDGGTTWEDNGAGTSGSFNGLASSTAYPIRVRAYDNANPPNYSAPLSLSMTTNAPAPVPIGTFKTRTFANNTDAGWPQGTMVYWEWHQAGRIGTAATSVTRGNTALAADGTLTITGCPSGAGYLLAAIRAATTDLDNPYYEYGSVA